MKIYQMVFMVPMLVVLMVMASNTSYHSHDTQECFVNFINEKPNYNKKNKIIHGCRQTPIHKGNLILNKKSFTKERAVYEIRDNYTLIENITIPKDCILKFAGGSISGEHTLTGQNTIIIAGPTKVLRNGIIIDGTWNNTHSYSQWFDFSKDGSSDDTQKFQNLLNFGGEIEIEPDITINIGSILFLNANTNANTSCRIHSNTTILGNNATLKLADNILLSNNTNMIWSDWNVENVRFYDLFFDGNSKYNKFTSFSPTRTSYFIYINGGKDVIIERCKFLNTAGRNCIYLYRGSGGDYYNARIRDCYFKNGGAYISDGTLNANQNDISFIYTMFENTVVENCTFINCDLDTEDSIDGVPYETRVNYLRNTDWGNGGVELHADNSKCLNCLFVGCDIGVYVAYRSKGDLIRHVEVSNNIIEMCSLGINLYEETKFDTINILGNRITLLGTNANQQIGIGMTNTPYDVYMNNALIANNDITCLEPSNTACLIKLFAGKNITVASNKLHASTNEHAISIVDSRANYSGLNHATFENIRISDNIITFDAASPKMSAVNCDYGVFNGSNANNRSIANVSVCDNVIIFNGDNATSTENTVFNGLQIFENAYRRPHVSNVTYVRNKISKNGVRYIDDEKYFNSDWLLKIFDFEIKNNLLY